MEKEDTATTANTTKATGKRSAAAVLRKTLNAPSKREKHDDSIEQPTSLDIDEKEEQPTSASLDVDEQEDDD